MQGKLIASYRRELSALDDLQCAGTVTYTLTQEADAFVITVQRDGARAAACMLCEIEEERAGMLTRFLYENAVEPAQILQEISTMQPDPEPAVLVLVPVPEETAARKALGLFAQYRIMLRPYGMKNLFDEIYRMGTTDDEHRLYHLRRCCEDVLDDFGARSTLNGYRYAERMLLYALYAERPQKIGDLQQYVASEENIEIGTVTSALNRMSAGMSKRGAEPYRGLCLRCGRPENGVLSNGQLFEGLLKELRRRLEPTV